MNNSIIENKSVFEIHHSLFVNSELFTEKQRFIKIIPKIMLRIYSFLSNSMSCHESIITFYQIH